MSTKKEEVPKTDFLCIGGDHQTFIHNYLKIRNERKIVNQWISTQMIQVTQADYQTMVNELKGSPELIAQIPKAQTGFIISGLFEVEHEPKKIIT